MRERVPDYMVPSAFIMLDELPLTANGKVDRRALALIHATPTPANTYVEARTAVEHTLAGIWRDVLRCEREVGIHDNFFELGGDSILSIQIMARATQAGLRLTPRQLFEHPTIAALAEVAGTAGAVQAEQGTVTGSVPLTPIQRSFFAHHAAYPQHWNMALMLEVRERRYTAGALREAMQAIVAHHDALRLRFKFDGERWQQWNAEAETHEFFSVVDLSTVPTAERAAAIEEHAAQLQASLNLGEGPLLRVCYYEMGEGEAARLLIIIHHLAVDGVSWRILLEDVASGCEQAVRQQEEEEGVEIRLAAKTTSYKEWAERLQEYAQGEELTRQQAHWEGVRARARGVRPLPVDVEGGEPQVGTTRVVSVELSREETEALLTRVPEVYRTEINDVLLTALVETMRQWTGQRRVVVEMEGHGREEIGEGVDVTRTVGWFTTHYPVVIEVEEGAGIGEALKAVKEELRGVPERGLGWGLWQWMRTEGETGAGGAGSASINSEELEAEISFNYLGQFDQVLGGDAAFVPARESAGPEQSPTGKRNRLLSITGRVSGGRLLMNWSYSEAVHRRETIEKVAEGFTAALRKIIAHCQSPEAGGYTPSDFPDADLSQSELDDLIASMGQADVQDWN
jgi:non-ribosomal peptide synthase protein (TIGR01720 family)